MITPAPGRLEARDGLARRDPVIAGLEAARRALAKATSVPAVKRVADVAAAAEVYARRQQLGEEAIGYAYALKIEALARLGELLGPMPKNPGTRLLGSAKGESGRITGGSVLAPPVNVPTYAELGVGRREAMIAQRLAELPADVRARIAAREITLTDARRRAKHAARPAVALPEGTYRVLYADPPWRYRDTRAGLGAESQATDRAETAAEQDYPTRSVEDLCALDVGARAAPDSVLFCWATFPLLPDALRVVEAWGFEYKTAFVWQKPRGSFGHYHRADAELLLVATRGSCTPDDETRHSQVVRGEAAVHSRKPEAFRELIDRLYVHGPRIELFARRPVPPPWEAWGNEP